MLTEEQKAIVYCPIRHFKVLSAAGSGKTTVLADRIKQLCTNGADPAGIMAITFTRRAGKELVSRLDSHCRSALIGTFHSTILQVMHRNGMMPNVLSDQESARLIEECADKLFLRVKGKYLKGHSFEKLSKKLEESRLTGIDDAFTSMYKSTMAYDGDIDFDGILHKGVEMARDGLFDWVEHLFVDEAQDNSRLQWDFVNAISKHASVMVVGDIGQSLYSFRGAVPEHFDAIDWPTLEMTESFRFPSNLADVSNRIGVTPLRVVSRKPASPINIIQSADTADLVKWLLREGIDHSDIAVLCRYNSQVEQQRSDLMRNGVNVTVPSIEIKGVVHHLLSYLASPSSRTSREKLSLWTDTRPKIVQYIQSTMSIHTCADICNNWLFDTGRTVGGVIAKAELPEPFIPEASYLCREYGDMTIDQYKAETSEQEWIADGTGVTVATIHWSKGGQWPFVILPQMDKGVWPRHKCTEDELRALYVAITRTQEQLYVMWEKEKSEFVTNFLDMPLAIKP